MPYCFPKEPLVDKLKRATHKQISNFGAGPAKLPADVLCRLQQEMLDFDQTGMSILEISHRSATFAAVLKECEQLTRKLLQVPSNYRVAFMQGGATGQFAAVALNLIARSASKTASYVVTGSWSQKAAEEARKFVNVHPVLPAVSRFTGVDESVTWNYHEDSAYVYFCSNETIDGVQFEDVPRFVPANVPLVCDMSSDILSRHVDISKYGVVFAGAQKNLGPAGVTVVIVREDLLHHCVQECPSVLSYKTICDGNSLYNTPPVFAVYTMNLVMKWAERIGGLAQLSRLNEQKASLVYRTIDESDGFYWCPVDAAWRSRMNIPFRIRVGCNGEATCSEALEKRFLKEAEAEGLLCLAGHRSVGGLRASLYNAVTLDDAQRLATFMRHFADAYQAQQPQHVAAAVPPPVAATAV